MQHNLGLFLRDSEKLKIEIQQREDLLAKFKDEAVTVQEEKLKAKRMNEWLIKKMGEVQVPEVKLFI